ncbi:hypothetical protein BH09MYX1_BH09MYX1_20150 [soil metagenome]
MLGDVRRVFEAPDKLVARTATGVVFLDSEGRLVADTALGVPDDVEPVGANLLLVGNGAVLRVWDIHRAQFVATSTFSDEVRDIWHSSGGRMVAAHVGGIVHVLRLPMLEPAFALNEPDKIRAFGFIDGTDDQFLYKEQDGRIFVIRSDGSRIAELWRAGERGGVRMSIGPTTVLFADMVTGSVVIFSRHRDAWTRTGEFSLEPHRFLEPVTLGGKMVALACCSKGRTRVVDFSGRELARFDVDASLYASIPVFVDSARLLVDDGVALSLRDRAG